MFTLIANKTAKLPNLFNDKHIEIFLPILINFLQFKLLFYQQSHIDVFKQTTGCSPLTSNSCVVILLLLIQYFLPYC